MHSGLKLGVRLVLGLVLMGSFIALGPGCNANRAPCQSNDDCQFGEVCVSGLCGGKLICAAGKICDAQKAPSPDPVPQTPPQQADTCTPGEKHCDGNTLKVCHTDGKTWARLDCGGFHTCKSGTCIRKGLSKICGNKKVEEGEQCDDGNTISGDGCSRYCLNEKIDRMEAPILERGPEPFVLGSRRCRDPKVRKNFKQSKSTLYVIVSPVVCRQNGRPVASAATLKQHVDFLNKVYRGASMVFLLGKTRWEDDADQCEVFYDTESSSTLRRYQLSNAISVFYARNIHGGNFSIAGFANLSGVVLNSGAFKAHETLAHELGHSFGLDHPHACYHGREKQSNCSTHGDQLCDTPADPGPARVKGLDVCPDRKVKNGACTVVNCRTVNCPGGEKPLIDNLMSYYHCGVALTSDQLATVRCVAHHEQKNRVSSKRPCTTDAECGNGKCKNKFCESSTPACTKHEDCGTGLRCDAGQCVACVQDRDAADSDGLCCSGERNGKGACCTKAGCCGKQNHSMYTADGKCRCEDGYTWLDPVAPTDFRCKSRGGPTCQLDGMWAATDGECCSKERDDQGKCCTGKGCCAARNNSYTGNDGKCQCQLGYQWTTDGDPSDRRCKKIPAPTCKKDGEAASSDGACCSKERNDKGACCTGNGCCGPQNNSFTASNGKCQCKDGYEWVDGGSSQTDFRCKKKPQTPTCKKDGEAASSDGECCSKERNDVGKCCTGKECCADRNNSFTASNGKCQCKNGFVWSAPNAQNDYRCKTPDPPPCKKDKEAAATDGECCSKERNDKGKCCSGMNCCGPQNNSYTGTDGKCHCSNGYEWVTTNNQQDFRCKKKPQNPGGGGITCAAKATLTGHSNLIRAVDISRDGKTVASGSYDKTIKLWDAATGKLIRTMSGHRNAVMSVHFRPGKAELASGDYSREYRRWNTSTGRYLSSMQLRAAVRIVRFRPDGGQVMMGTENGLSLWNIPGSGYSFANGAFIRGGEYSPDAKLIAIGRKNKTVELYSASNRQRLRVLKGHASHVFDVAFSADSSILASAGKDLILWKASDGSQIRKIQGTHNGATFNVVLHPTKRFAFTSGNDNDIKVWDMDTGAKVQTLSGHSGDIYTLAISPDGKTLASGSKDNTVRLWSCQ